MSLLALYGLTTVHHVYGAVADDSVSRLHAAAVVLVPVGAGVIALLGYRETGRRSAAIAYAWIACFLGILLGLVHSAYSHLYKDLLYLAGGSSDSYLLINPEEHYPPDDLFFEITGILELGVATWVVVAATRLVRFARTESQAATTPSEVTA